MNTMTKATAKDFFFQLGIIISLYAGVGFLLNLLFSVINTAYPQINSYSGGQNISFPVAALIILTPVFLVLSSFVSKAEMVDPDKKEIWIRRWSTFLTMFLSGAIIVGDLITLLYYFLDGRDLTVAFLLKVLAVLIVLGSLFGYYWSNLKSTLSSGTRTIWRIGAIVIVLIAIALGFTVIGSPQTQRLYRYDEQKTADLQGIQQQIISYWQMKGTLPTILADLNNSLSYYSIPSDSQTGVAYEYTRTGAQTFSICAVFNLATRASSPYQTAYYPGVSKNENWTHGAGRTCFDRTIDLQMYPIYNKGIAVPVPVPASAY